MEEKVMLDIDLAQLYGVETRVLKQAMNKNIELFPDEPNEKKKKCYPG